MSEIEEVCGTCRHNSRDHGEYVCGNEESEAYGLETLWDDWCRCWEEKEV